MYTIVFYNAETLELIMTQESGTKPKIKEAKHPFYIQKGAFDGVVDPSKGLDTETEEQRLGRKLKETEAALFELMTR